MANIITAGNSTNGGTAISTDTSGTLNIVTGSGSGANAVTVDGSGNVVVTGTITASGGVSGGIRSGTAVASTSGTSIDFTGIPSTVKRITVMLSGVSTNGSSVPIIQLGTSSGIETTGYTGASSEIGNSVATSVVITPSNGLALQGGFASSISLTGTVVFTLLGSNLWTATGAVIRVAATNLTSMAGGKTTAATLDRIRITTAGGTDTFDAGSINILFE